MNPHCQVCTHYHGGVNAPCDQGFTPWPLTGIRKCDYFHHRDSSWPKEAIDAQVEHLKSFIEAEVMKGV